MVMIVKDEIIEPLEMPLQHKMRTGLDGVTIVYFWCSAESVVACVDEGY